MNQGRIWCVVKPTVGLPLFLGSVALTSLAVHYAVLSHTTWMSSYWQGGAKKTALLETTAPQVAAVTPGANSAYTVSVTPAANGGASFVVTVVPNQTVSAADGTTADKPPGRLALASPVPK
jgi:light-harvesting protein B-800-850 alpha chain